MRNSHGRIILIVAAALALILFVAFTARQTSDQQVTKEHFATTTNTTNTTNNASNASPYVENVSGGFPQADNMIFYLTSFSDLTSYGSPTYISSTQRWMNYGSNLLLQDYDNAFFLSGSSGGVVPAAITSNIGLLTKNVQLLGPSSHIFDSRGALDQFTVAFYAKTNSLSFQNSRSTIPIFSLIADSPNYVDLSLTSNLSDADKVNLTFDAGTEQYVWPLDRNKLLNDTALYSITYSTKTLTTSNTPTVNLYVGSTASTVDPAGKYDKTKPIVPGTEQVTLNTIRGWDASLFAFAYFQTALTGAEITQLLTYIQKEASGTTRQLDHLASLQQQARIFYDNLVYNSTNQLKSLKEQLLTCTTSSATLKKEAKTINETDKWHVYDNPYGHEYVSENHNRPVTTNSTQVATPATSNSSPVSAQVNTAVASVNTSNIQPSSRYVVAYPWETSGTTTVTAPVVSNSNVSNTTQVATQVNSNAAPVYNAKDITSKANKVDTSAVKYSGNSVPPATPIQISNTSTIVSDPIWVVPNSNPTSDWWVT